ncbi:metallophosphoesterase [Variovorax sp. PBL-E5]|uniref:metallophosphoesterase n=1 Tax=Variovorax sp. PBL-E5 TaxID=434014 RepID=UPI0013183C24|nr:metallophosphoesterase [Variovorax sp. PBL-E5]VTU24617.1 Calcineurin-like phosphoesterase superfamily domain protein [Variovorax sp. PBL-E5]
MKLNILSDLHLSRGGLPHPKTDADLVILAGDIARPAQAMAWARGFDRPVLYVAGNHEFYGGSVDGTLRELKALSAGTGIQVLDDESIVIDGVRFLGTTLWTDFNLLGTGSERVAAMEQAARLTYDFSRIRLHDASPALFTPADSAALFARHATWLNARLAEPHAGPTVVITHHAPAPGSIHPRFEGSPINASFVSDLRASMGRDRVDLWIHGHTHDSFDYRVDGTRVLCNPRGYLRDEVNENPLFDPLLTVEIGAASGLSP